MSSFSQWVLNMTIGRSPESFFRSETKFFQLDDTVTCHPDDSFVTLRIALADQNYFLPIVVCDPNPCMNGGTCTRDVINYHCACTDCWGGVCCNETICKCLHHHNHFYSTYLLILLYSIFALTNRTYQLVSSGEPSLLILHSLAINKMQDFLTFLSMRHSILTIKAKCAHLSSYHA